MLVTKWVRCSFIGPELFIGLDMGYTKEKTGSWLESELFSFETSDRI